MAMPIMSLAVVGNVRIQDGHALLDLTCGGASAEAGSEVGAQPAAADDGLARPPQPVEISKRIKEGTLAVAANKQALTPNEDR